MSHYTPWPIGIRGGALGINYDGNVYLLADGRLILQSGGGLTLSSTSDIVMSGGNIQMATGGDLNMTGGDINLTGGDLEIVGTGHVNIQNGSNWIWLDPTGIDIQGVNVDIDATSNLSLAGGRLNIDSSQIYLGSTGGYTYIYDKTSGNPVLKLGYTDANNYRLFLYKTGAWREILPTDLMDVGYGFQYWGSGTPNGALLCNGQWVSMTTYSALYGVMGDLNTYGGKSMVGAGQDVLWRDNAVTQEDWTGAFWYLGRPLTVLTKSAGCTLTVGSTYYVRVDEHNSYAFHLYNSVADATADVNRIALGTEPKTFTYRQQGCFKLPTVANTYVRY
jgi:hypothetical protein